MAFVKTTLHLVAAFLLICAIIGTSAKENKIKLKNLEVITLEAGKRTTGRRAAAVPQLRCIGGSAGCSYFRPKVVQCYNRGWDGKSFQWECKAEMESNLKFGRVEVSCEGYDYAEDDYVLVGSCGLEYELDLIGERPHKTNFEHLQRAKQNYYKGLAPSASSKTRSYSTYLIVVFICFVLIVVIYQCRAHNQRQHSPLPTRSSSPEPPGFRQSYTYSRPDLEGNATWRNVHHDDAGPSAPPNEDSYSEFRGESCSSGANNYRYASTGIPFWNRLFRQGSRSRNCKPKPSTNNSSYRSSSSSCSSSSSSVTTHISTGFGGTKVR